MTIIVEDGTIVSGANSYVTESELGIFAGERGAILSTNTEILINKAMDYIETQAFIGDKYTRDQPLQFPRSNMVIDGYSYDVTAIPSLLKTALMATCISIDGGIDPLATVSRETKREKVSDIEVEYQDNARAVESVRTVQSALRKLIVNNGLCVQVSRV